MGKLPLYDWHKKGWLERISVRFSALAAKEPFYIFSPFLCPLPSCSHNWQRETMFPYVVLFSVFHNKNKERSHALYETVIAKWIIIWHSSEKNMKLIMTCSSYSIWNLAICQIYFPLTFLKTSPLVLFRYLLLPVFLSILAVIYPYSIISICSLGSTTFLPQHECILKQTNTCRKRKENTETNKNKELLA